MKTRGAWCGRCGPVAAQKPTHRLRNTVATLTFPLSLFLWMDGWFAFDRGRWHCPRCRGPVLNVAKAQSHHQRQEAIRKGWTWMKAHPKTSTACAASMFVLAALDNGTA